MFCQTPWQLNRAGAIKDYLVNDPKTQRTRTLAESLRRRRQVTVNVDSTLCALLACLDIAEALKFMHRSKTLHGDLKPQNILIVSTVRHCSLFALIHATYAMAPLLLSLPVKVKMSLQCTIVRASTQWRPSYCRTYSPPSCVL